MTHDLPILPERSVDAHKGTFGTVCVIGGQAAAPRVMIGAPAFAATAALRSGCGLAVLAVPSPIMPAALVIAPGATGLSLPVDGSRSLKPSAVAELLDERAGDFDCLAIGPGWGDEEPQQQVLVRLLAREGAPMVVDADALNAMTRIPEVQGDLRRPMVLTPHPGEYRRLARHFKLDPETDGPARRRAAAEALARRLGCVVVLKGAQTVISDGLETAVNETGNVALATAGTGDVLTGVIAGLVAQFRGSSSGGALGLFDCSRVGVHLHGRAADLWASRHGYAGMTAGDLVDLVPEALAELPRGAGIEAKP
ncbi:MAG: NAD(P)H-hydrate dehydratase [Planctomycetes bacterium]|nr:NAD(P)H-hydrate dehydratase [Planctomycetota bacterium]